MQDLTAMAYFVHVVERGGFTAAARHLSEPLSTISRRVVDLERSLSVRLLERSTRRVRLTDLGEEYYEFCRRGLQEFDSANLLIQDRQSDVAGLLRITVPPSFPETIFAPVLATFRRKYPNARVAVSVTERYVDLLNERYDVALRIGALKDSSLSARRLASITSKIVASPAYLESRPRIARPEDLAAHDIISFDSSGRPVTWALYSKSAAKPENAMQIVLTPKLAYNNFSAIQAISEEGCGIAQIPEIHCAVALKEKRLLPVLEDWASAPAEIFAVTLGTRNMSRIVRLFLDHAVPVLSSIEA